MARSYRLSPQGRANIAAAARAARLAASPLTALNADQRRLYDKLKRSGFSQAEALAEADRA